MEWTDKLSADIASVDRRHQVIVGYINELHDGLEGGAVKGILDHVLEGLVNDTRTHFAYEEMPLGVYGYDGKAHTAHLIESGANQPRPARS